MTVTVKRFGAMKERMQFNKKNLVVIQLTVPERKAGRKCFHVFLPFYLIKNTAIGRKVGEQCLTGETGAFFHGKIGFLTENIVARIAFTKYGTSVQAVEHVSSGHFFFHEAVRKDNIVGIQKITENISHCHHLRTVVAAHFLKWGTMPGVQIDLTFFFDKSARKRGIVDQITGAA